MEKRAAGEEQVVRTACAHHCGGSCVWKVHIRDGVITRLEPDDDPKEDQLRGCMRAHALRQQVYAPDRLRYPLKRVGERGENIWERVSWEQALDQIADRLKQIKAKYGAESLAISEGTYRSDMYGVRTRFLNLFGNPGNIGCPGIVCGCNKHALRTALLGTGTLRDIVENAKCIVFCGWNITETRRRVWLDIRERIQKGGKIKLIVIDPKQTEVAKNADLWLQIRPGTDAALFLSWINVIIEERLYDETFVDKWTFGFDQLKQRASEYTPERVAGITWISAEKKGNRQECMRQTNRPLSVCLV